MGDEIGRENDISLHQKRYFTDNQMLMADQALYSKIGFDDPLQINFHWQSQPVSASLKFCHSATSNVLCPIIPRTNDTAMMLPKWLSVLCISYRSVSLASRSGTEATNEQTRDDSSVDGCMYGMAQTRGDAYSGLFLNPALLVSLALNYDRTGSCRLDDPPMDASGKAGSPTLVQQNGPRVGSTRAVKREDDESSSLDLRPTPAPTGSSSPGTTIHIASEHDFALLLPGRLRGTHEQRLPSLSR